MTYSKPLPFIQSINNVKKPQLVYSTSDNSGEAPLKNIKKLSDCWLDLGICRTTIQCIIIFPPLSGLSSLVFSHNGVKKVVELIYNPYLKWIYTIKICRLSYRGYKKLRNSIWKVNCKTNKFLFVSHSWCKLLDSNTELWINYQWLAFLISLSQ